MNVLCNKDLFIPIAASLELHDEIQCGLTCKTLYSFITTYGWDYLTSQVSGNHLIKRKIAEAPLPPNIYCTYNAIFQLSIAHNINQKPLLFLVDPTLRLPELGSLMEPFFKEKTEQPGFQHFKNVLAHKCQTGYTEFPKYEPPLVIEDTKPYWGLMVNGILAKDKPFEVQKKLVSTMKVGGKALSLPNVEEAATGVFTEWITTRTCQFSTHETLRTNDVVRKISGKVIVSIQGIDSEKGLDIIFLEIQQNSIFFGVAPFLKL